jgi:hypothetical protein
MRLSIKTLKKIEEIFGEFDVSQVLGGNNDVYLRFGYWRQVNVSKLQEVVGSGVKIFEEDYYDDDCGYLFSYKVKDIF